MPIDPITGNVSADRPNGQRVSRIASGEARHLVIFHPLILSIAVIACACRQASITLRDPGRTVECPFCKRGYTITGIRFDAAKGPVEVDISRKDPTILPAGSGA